MANNFQHLCHFQSLLALIRLEARRLRLKHFSIPPRMVEFKNLLSHPHLQPAFHPDYVSMYILKSRLVKFTRSN